MTTLSNPKLVLPSPLKHLFGCHFENPWKKENIIATFQSGKLTDDLDRFNLKFSRNCPIRIEIITARGKIFGIKCQPVVKTI